MALSAAAEAAAPTIGTCPEAATLLRDGWVLLRGALGPDEVAALRAMLRDAAARGLGAEPNQFGNMGFDSLLEHYPERVRPLVGHASVRPLLLALFGPQCQLRSLRGHLNVGAYRQEWHLDCYGHWHERSLLERHPLAAAPQTVNTTFYLQDNTPDFGRLSFVRGGHRQPPPHLYPMAFEAFQRWCEGQPHDDVHPLAGDCVVFLSHLPHQGAKVDAASERGNVVCHYQGCPMHERLWHVSSPSGSAGPFVPYPAPTDGPLGSGYGHRVAAEPPPFSPRR